MRSTPLTPADYRRMPWKNGLGTTAEIVRVPAEGDLDWRVSVADVAADGPFSAFPGCDRIILTLEGEGIVLRHDEPGLEATLGPLEPWSFSGDWTTSCSLRHGPIRDFNVIARRDAYRARVEVLRLQHSQELEMAPARTMVLYCVAGDVAVGNGERIELTREDAVIVDRVEGVEWLRLVPLSGTPVLIRVDIRALV